ncbi:uncharacterized protein LACBIDRAFT_327605 [Laccaria bicolor S238N-H82]|uniref:Predicted protein n=1 Tax=Laccaria bicolor (strain S238N-H82 / ATCC MYA-4686) TaxID=486041 RepID=B0DC87_LACBS|nr:uncharacterized protein LACBIDRAFT_327605 [Laccaria bicolor S238N-H82]EDR07853.1 predicted protein [Laccaria bicolor S238N-H82]|eukprot:XP_001881642.1 predicted protein [Laccaria bicolor S238N-H82]
MSSNVVGREDCTNSNGGRVQQMLGCRSWEQVASDNGDNCFLIVSTTLHGQHGPPNAEPTYLIALSPDPIDYANVTILINVLRTTTSNEQIFADKCDVSSPTSIRSFCTRFLTRQGQRIGTIIFAHEYHQIGSFVSRLDKEKERNAGSLATFLITTLLLPALPVAPVERDIRTINVVNPFYAAAATLLPLFDFPKDALPSAQLPELEEGSSSVPVVNTKAQNPPIVRIFFTSPEIAMQSMLHALFIPTPFKVPMQPTQVPDAMPQKC